MGKCVIQGYRHALERGKTGQKSSVNRITSGNSRNNRLEKVRFTKENECQTARMVEFVEKIRSN